MKKMITGWLVAIFILTCSPQGTLALPANQYASQAYMITDTALADDSDEVEIDVYLVDQNFNPVIDQSVYCATDMSQAKVTVGPNEEGWIRLTITSAKAGMARLAISLGSADQAKAYLSGQGGGSAAAQIIQIEQKYEIGLIYFTAGSLSEDSSFFEFDKDTVVVTGGDYADFIKAKLFLRTEQDHPVANQYVKLSSDLQGVTIWPDTLVTNGIGEGEFRISSTALGDAEIFAQVGEMLVSEYVTFDTPENIYEQEEEDWLEEEEEEEPELIISPLMTKVNFSKLMAKEHGSNANYGESTDPTAWDRIVISGIALSEEEEPVKGPSKINAYATAGELNKVKPATTSTAGAFSFTITSEKVTQGTVAVGLGTPEQLKAYIEDRISAEECGLITTQAYYFGGRKLDKFLLCAIDQLATVENGVAKTLEVAPISQEGRTLLALRPIADTLGAKTLWDPATQTATIIHGESTLKITVGKPFMTREIYGRSETIPLEAPAKIISERTVFPLRSVAAAFDMEVVYEPQDRSICISSHK